MAAELESIIINKLADLEPTHLELIDESHLHIGHAGVAQRDGKHYSLIISSPKFANLSLIKQHQLIYQMLGNLMSKEIHALRIKII